MKRFSLFSGLLVLIFFTLSCGKDSPTAPTKTTPPTTTPTIVSVTVTSDHSTVAVGNTEQMTATVKMSDNTTKAGSGTWSCGNTVVATVDSSGLVRGKQSGGVDIVFDNAAGGRGLKTLTVRDVWKRSGVGATVFDMPTYVSRVKIMGTYTGGGENFVVWVGNDLLVNVILGTRWESTRYEGVHLTKGGVTQVKYSSGLQWSLEETDPKNMEIGFPTPIIWQRAVPGGEREFEIYKRTSEGKR